MAQRRQKKENRRRKRKKNCPGFVLAEWRVKLAISSLYPLPAWSLSHLTNNKNHNHHYNNHSAFLRQRFQIRRLEAEISWPFKNSSILLVQSSGRWRKFLAGTYISILEHSLSPKVYFSVFTDRQSKYCRRDIKKGPSTNIYNQNSDAHSSNYTKFYASPAPKPNHTFKKMVHIHTKKNLIFYITFVVMVTRRYFEISQLSGLCFLSIGNK